MGNLQEIASEIIDVSSTDRDLGASRAAKSVEILCRREPCDLLVDIWSHTQP